ncbi:alpha/beta-hydrolase [Decorospora gaudefroyi]|uniref:Alpha/beta-hydrolase n=1 Tax=Decorospora gaudefroyi TaxID=184978 RepID=A0A6A5K1Z5_9PLEO|nr:alpha/beta-hydrolase [Decorospora gaudefroyi]
MHDKTAIEGTSIRVTQRDERSFLMSVVQFLVRRMRSHIGNREAKHESGSITLNPSKSKLDSCTLQERTVCDIHIYDFVPPNKPEKMPKKRIYYFAGGSWQKPPTGQHYLLCAKMAKDMPEAIISVVSTPLAPNNPAPSSFAWILKAYRALMAEAKEAGERVILAGDSSGANITLSIVLEALREDAEQTDGGIQLNTHPTAIMAISPSTDLTRNNPDIEKMAHKDPLLTPKIISGTAKAWHADWDPADRRVSPINGDISLLAKQGVKVHGMTGGCDILSPDGILFRDRCAEHGVEGEWVHWEKQMHCFILTLPYRLVEAKAAMQWMIEVLKKE